MSQKSPSVESVYLDSKSEEYRRDDDLEGMTFFVWGAFPEFIAGVNLSDSDGIISLIESHGGICLDSISPDVDVVIFGQYFFFPEEYREYAGAVSEDIAFLLYERYQSEWLRHWSDASNRKVWRMSVDDLLRVLCMGDYYDPNNTDFLMKNYWSQIE